MLAWSPACWTVAEEGAPRFIARDDSVQRLSGPSPTLEMFHENKTVPFAHEAGVFIPRDNTLFITSNRFPDPANGGVNYRDGILFCAQGTLDSPGGLSLVESSPPYRSGYLLTSFSDSRPFNSPNDVVVHADGSVWFPDPIYGSEQGFRPKPPLPSQVYRSDPGTGSIRVVVDGFGRPNGISFSPGQTVVYVTDTDQIHGEREMDDARVSTM